MLKINIFFLRKVELKSWVSCKIFIALKSKVANILTARIKQMIYH